MRLAQTQGDMLVLKKHYLQGDQINTVEDISKLSKLEAYFR